MTDEGDPQGGLGPMSRMWGSALDHIVEVEVVTANGTIVRANDQENSDLFYVRFSSSPTVFVSLLTVLAGSSRSRR